MRYLVIGCGRMGAGLARALHTAHHSVAVVDNDPAAFARLGAAFTGEQILGVAFDRDVLERAGIGHADGLAAVTGNDEANAVTARLATRVFHVPRVVARLYDPRQAHIYRGLGLQVITPVDWGVQRLVELLTFSGVGVTASIGTGQVDLVETELPHLLEGRLLDEVTAPGEILPVAISRGGRTFIPTQATVLEAGDILHLAVVGRSRGRLWSLLGER